MMPTKARWTFNPRKWFGTLSSGTPKPDRRININNSIAPRQPTTKTSSSSITTTTTTTKTRTGTGTEKLQSTSTNSRILITRSKTKIPSNSTFITDSSSGSLVESYTHLQLLPYNARRENTSLLPIAKYPNHANILVPKRTEPSIPSLGQTNKKLTVITKRIHAEPTVNERSKILPLSSSPTSLHRNFSQKDTIDFVQSDYNISILSNECIISYPQSSSNNLIGKYQSSGRTHSSSSINDNDVRDESTSSGIFTDERTDTNDGLGLPSKDTLSTVEFLSVESIDDSQASFNHYQSRSFTNYYRLPASIPEKENNQPLLLQRQKLPNRIHRDNSTESILKDNQINIPVATKNRQSSSAAIVKKIEKRHIANRSPSATLEKAGLVRVANDTYRLAIEKDNHLYHRARRNSVVNYSSHDDSLPPANDEESYAAVPRTSSTEQLNDNLQNDARAIVDDCIRPMASSTNKTSDKYTKPQYRPKRPTVSYDHSKINIDEMVVKLLSSVDCSTYAQYQRCLQ